MSSGRQFKNIKIVGLLILLGFTVNSNAELHRWGIYNPNPDLQGIITCVAQDSTGYMWFGTTNGLYRYDGIQYTKYTWENGFNSISHHIINDIYVDRQSRLWMLTSGFFCKLLVANFT